MTKKPQIAPKKPRGKPFQKGNTTAKAGGLAKKKTQQEFDLVAACKAKTVDALTVIADIMVNGEKEQTRLAAALAIIERGYGKPVQPIAGDPERPLEVIVQWRSHPVL